MTVQTTRSPSSPSHSLQQCLKVALDVYSKFAHSIFGQADVASAMKMSATSGGFKSWLSDMKQYGMILKKGPGAFEVSQDVKDYSVIGDENPSEAIDLKIKLLNNSPFFEKLIQSFDGKVPEQDALSKVLMSQYGFNKNKAAVTARALSDSMYWVGILDEKRNIITPNANIYREEDGYSFEPAGLHHESVQAQGMQNVSSTKPALTISSNLSMQLALCNNRVLEIAYPPDLTETEAGMVAAVLDAIAKNGKSGE